MYVLQQSLYLTSIIYKFARTLNNDPKFQHQIDQLLQQDKTIVLS
jgi:hypothetical protein